MIHIMHETPTWLLVYKDAGLPVETKAFGKRSLETEVMRYLLEKQKNIPYLATINRLDQPVEGLVLFAKTKKTAASLSKQLQAHQIEKEYLAVTEGNLSAEQLPEKPVTLTDYLVTDNRSNTTKVVSEGTPGARKAILTYRVTGQNEGGQQLLQIRLLTGRHHQIRVQLAHAGFPIAGDLKYGKKDKEIQESVQKTAARSFPALCAWRLAFTDPDTGRAFRKSVQPGNPIFQIFDETILKLAEL